MVLFSVLAFIIFVIAAVVAFFADDTEVMTVLGIISAGLAAMVAAGFSWLNDRIR